MDGEHQYEITLKKDGLFINLSSDDVYFISKQMDKWFRILLDDSYVPVSLPQRPEPVPPPPVVQAPAQAVAQPAPEVQPAPQPVAPQPEPVAVAPIAVAAPQPEVAPVAPQPAVAASQYADVNLPMAQQPAVPQPVVQPVPEVQPAPQPVAPQPEPQPVAVAPVQPALPAEPIPQPMPVAAPQPAVAIAQPQPIAQPIPEPVAVQAPLLQPQPQPQPTAVGVAVAPQPPIQQEGQDDFEAVMDSLMKDLDDSAEENALPYTAPMNMGGGEPDLTLVTSLADLCDRSNAANSEDYLLLSAYYLTRIERQATFSLKKVNSALVKSGLTPVNHSILETVLSRGFLSMVPDLNGTAEVSEYMITTEGQQAATALL